MKASRCIWFIIFELTFNFAYAEPTAGVAWRRICKSGRDNVLFWHPSNDVCANFKYEIWARDGIVGAFTKIGTITNSTVDSYTHLNAYAGVGANWFYFIQSVDDCGAISDLYSDTIGVDLTLTSLTVFDSVSVDPVTNKVYLGWKNNLSPDFKAFTIVRKKGANYSFLNGTGSRDTFWIDDDENPSFGPLEYDIGSIDSCNNRDTLNVNPHSTIYLTFKLDTCDKTIQLNWTPYRGWKKIRRYYVYRSLNGGGYQEYDSVPGDILSYSSSIGLGDNQNWFVRAYRDTNPSFSSSSNSVFFATRLRVDPTSTILSNVSVILPEDDRISIEIERGAGEEASKYDVHKALNGGNFQNIATIAGVGGQTLSYLDFTSTKEQYSYKIVSYDLCAVPASETNISNNIVLSVEADGDKNILTWSKYMGWNPLSYQIARATGDNKSSLVFTPINEIIGSDTAYTDQQLPTRIGNTGVCYYIMAKSSGQQVSLSNITCNVGQMVAFVPNAFNPSGLNTHFKPEGSFINYEDSEMEVYDRWGGLVVKISGITSGWDGNNQQGSPCQAGVYFYKISLISVDAKEKQSRTGTVTLIK